jgi:large subunit ribosomal protein L10
MPNNKNIETVKDLREKVAKAKSIIFADMQGMKSNDTNDFRQKMRENNAEVAMSKNSLLEIALKEENKDVEQIAPHLKGATVAILAYNDPIAPIKAFFELAKKFEKIKVKAGLVDNKFTTSGEVETLSKLPSREQLVAQILRTLNSPVAGLVNVLSGTPRKLVYALSAISKKKEVQ